MISSNAERVVWLIVGACFSWPAIVYGVEQAKGPAERKISRADTSTWPRAPKGLVRSFSMETHKKRIGFTLGKPDRSSRSVRWNWRTKGFKGEIRVATWRNAEEARVALSSFLLWGISTAPKLLVNEGETPGDIAWLHADRDNIFCWFSRRNVFIRMEIGVKDAAAAKAKSELLRLATAVTEAIDSEKLVEDPKLVEVPAIAVLLSDRGKPGGAATVRITWRKGKASDFKYSCATTPDELARVRTCTSTPNGDILYTVDLRKAGEAKIVVFAADKSGMTTKAVKTILIE